MQTIAKHVTEGLLAFRLAEAENQQESYEHVFRNRLFLNSKNKRWKIWIY